MQYTQHKTSSTLVLCCVLHNWHNGWSYIYCKHSFKILVNLTPNMVTNSFEWVDIHCRMNKVLLWIFLSSIDRFNVYTKEFEVKLLVGASWSLSMTEWVTVYLIPTLRMTIIGLAMLVHGWWELGILVVILQLSSQEVTLRSSNMNISSSIATSLSPFIWKVIFYCTFISKPRRVYKVKKVGKNVFKTYNLTCTVEVWWRA